MPSGSASTSNSRSSRKANGDAEEHGAAARDSNSSGLKPSCVRCANYLTEALASATTAADGPVRSLLDAMGASASLVQNHYNNGDGNGSNAAAAAAAATAVEAVITVPRVTKGKAVAAAEADRKQTIEHVDPSEAQKESILGNIRRRLTGAGNAMAPQHAAPILASGGGMAVATSAVRDGAQPNIDGDDDNNDGSISVSISCQQCSSTGPEGGARAFVRGPHPLSVVLCSNRLQSSAEVQEVLVHELIHVYDMHVRGLDFHDCHQLAYSEVRAARDAECRGSLNRFTMSYCVKERAGHATNNMFPHQEGRNCVGRVLESALADRSPFQKGVADELPDFTKYCSPK